MIEIPFRTFRRLSNKCREGDYVFWPTPIELRFGILSRFVEPWRYGHTKVLIYTWVAIGGEIHNGYQYVDIP